MSKLGSFGSFGWGPKDPKRPNLFRSESKEAAAAAEDGTVVKQFNNVFQQHPPDAQQVCYTSFSYYVQLDGR
jgi:hypothetical protein